MEKTLLELTTLQEEAVEVQEFLLIYNLLALADLAAEAMADSH